MDARPGLGYSDVDDGVLGLEDRSRRLVDCCQNPGHRRKEDCGNFVENSDTRAPAIPVCVRKEMRALRETAEPSRIHDEKRLRQ